MALKDALAVCLISLFSATLVLLIARSLDNQAAARLEPQLKQIVEQLEQINRQGTIVGTRQFTDTDTVVMYYFYGNQRCPTCRAIESQAHDALQKGFAAAIADGEIVWKTANYEDKANADLRDKFDVHVPVVVLAQMKGGEVANWKRLDQVWALWDEEEAFAEFMNTEIGSMLNQPVLNVADDAASEDQSEVSDESTDVSSLPLPGSSDTNEMP